MSQIVCGVGLTTQEIDTAPPQIPLTIMTLAYSNNTVYGVQCMEYSVHK